MRDILLQGPASSVEVEKQHANLQTDAEAKKSVGRRAHTIQKDSYIMSCCLEHSSTLAGVMTETLGKTKKKVMRVFRNARLLDSSAPAGLRVARSKMGEQGHVKGRPGLLKGMLPLVRVGYGMVALFAEHFCLASQ